MWRALASVAISRVLLHCRQVGRHRLLCGHRDHGMLVSSHVDPAAEHRTPTSRVDSIVSIEDARIANYEELFQTGLRTAGGGHESFRAPVVWWAAVIAPSEPTGQSSVARVTTALPTTSDRGPVMVETVVR